MSSSFLYLWFCTRYKWPYIRSNEHLLLIYRVDSVLSLICFSIVTTGNGCKFSWENLIMWASDAEFAFWLLCMFRLRTDEDLRADQLVISAYWAEKSLICRFFLFLLCYILFILTAEHPSYYVSFMGAGAVTVGYSESGGLVSNMTFKHEGIITRRLSDRVNSLGYHPITVRIKLGVELMDDGIASGSFYVRCPSLLTRDLFLAL